MGWSIRKLGSIGFWLLPAGFAALSWLTSSGCNSELDTSTNSGPGVKDDTGGVGDRSDAVVACLAARS